MFSLDVLHDRWIIMVLAGGPALVGAMALAYLAIWTPRRPQDAARPATAIKEEYSEDESPPQPIPWILILTYAGVAAYGMLYCVARALRPPNW
jgi:hypothetical protein